MAGENVDESQKYFKQRSQTQYFLRYSLNLTNPKRSQKVSTGDKIQKICPFG